MQKAIVKKPDKASISAELLPILQNLSALGLTQKQIGVCLGFQGKGARKWLERLMHRHPEAREAWKEGQKQADAALISSMYQAAIGYTTRQVKRKYKFEPNPTNKNRPKKVLVEEEEVEKTLPPVPQLAMFLALNHMPEFYKNKVELEKRTLSVDLKGTITADEIKQFAGKLDEYSKTLESKTENSAKPILDAEVIQPSTADVKIKEQ